jgi:copper oxidase (laccase) domain-containing protein
MTTTTSTSRRSSSSQIVAPAITIACSHGRRVSVRCSTLADGDFHRTAVPFAQLESRRRRFVDLPWTQLDQVHGTSVVRVDAPSADDGQPGDVALTDLEDVVLGCWVGDCAPVVLVGASSELAVVHAGWRGLTAGVIQAAIGAFTEPVVVAVLGSTIGPCCYEFGVAELDLVALGVGCDSSRIMSSTSSGRLALDVPEAVRAACGEVPVERIGGCTGCEYAGFSHRVRADPQRHVVAAWQHREVST